MVLFCTAPKGLVDTNHEIMTLGMCNTIGACVQAMPLSGAFSRYAISTACGLKTPMANLYCGKYYFYIVKAILESIKCFRCNCPVGFGLYQPLLQLYSRGHTGCHLDMFHIHIAGL